MFRLGGLLDLTSARISLGDLLLSQKNVPEAMQTYRAAAGALEQATDAGGGTQADNSINLKFVSLADAYARACFALGKLQKLPEALQACRERVAILERLTKTDTSKSEWQSDLAKSYQAVGYLLQVQKNLDEALEAHGNRRNLWEHLVKAEPGNAKWQEELADSYWTLGIILSKQNRLPEAEEAYRARLAIRERLASQDPTQTERQHALAGAYWSLGDVLNGRENPTGALEAYRRRLEITDRLAKADPDNTAWQTDLANCYESLAIEYQRARDWDNALSALRDGQTVAKRLTELPPAEAGEKAASWKKSLVWFEASIAELPHKRALVSILTVFEAGNFKKSVALQEALEKQTEKAERQKTGKLGEDTRGALVSLAWYDLFARDFKGALSAANRAIALDPGYLVAATNKAHALMFLGRKEEARALYLKNRGRRVEALGKSWEEAILGDFAEFERRGLKHHDMVAIKKLLSNGKAEH